jgi:methanogenic corrinoid protein MtbC1/DNA-binding XRE family transcriptional regulator
LEGSNLETAASDFYRRYLDALTEGDTRAATSVIDQALASGLVPSKIYLKILMPAQRELGELWHKGSVSVAEEHLATQITLDQMARLRHLFRPKASLGVHALVATVDGDPHYIGCRVVADFLYLDGWEVDFVGTNTPSQDLAQMVQAREVHLVAIGATLEESLPELARVVLALRALPRAPKIMIGGPVLQSYSSRISSELKPDALAFDARQAIEEARRVCGMLGSHASLNQYLKGLGARILERRKARRFSQQELANGAGLDRAYISSVENGKQNVTIGAIFKLADALEVSVEDLLVDSSRLR